MVLYKKAVKPEEKQKMRHIPGRIRRGRNDPRYLYPKGECHCDRCVTERFWAE